MSEERQAYHSGRYLKAGHPRWQNALAEVTAVSAIALLPLLYFWRLVTASAADRAYIAWGDFGAQYFPLRLFVARELAQGRLPLWNPFLNGGQPGLADSQSAVFYPPNFFLGKLVPNGELTIELLQYYIVAHFALAAIFTYIFARYALREHGRAISRLGALVSGVTFAFGGFLTSFPLQQLTILEATVWLPGLLLLLDLASARRSLGLFALAALPLALSWSAGHAQTTMYSLYTALAFLVAKTALGWTGRRDLKLLAGGLLTALLGTGLATAQLLPSYEFLGLSTRVDLSYRDTSFGLPPIELAGLVLPDVLGGRSVYVGVFGLTLAMLAIAVLLRHTGVRIWLGATVCGLLVSLGGNTFLYSALYLFVPGFAGIRNQERAVLVVALALSVLAGHGVAAMLSRDDGALESALRKIRAALLWTALGLFVLAILCAVFLPQSSPLAAGGRAASRAIWAALIMGMAAGLLWLRENRRLSASATAGFGLCLLVLDLFTVNWQGGLSDAKDARLYQDGPLTRAVSAELSAAKGSRLSSEGLLPGGGSAASVYRLRDIVANTPFQLKRFADVTNKVDELQRSRLLSVAYWLTKRQFDGDGRFDLRGQFGEVRLYALSEPALAPWANVVHDALVVPDGGAALRAVASTDLSKAVVLAAPPAVTLAMPSREEPAPVLLADTPIRQVLAVNLASPGILVVSEIHYPGWRVFVDDAEAELLRAQYLLRGVALTAGSHRIEFRYEPASLDYGLRVSALSGAMLILLLATVWLHPVSIWTRLAGIWR